MALEIATALIGLAGAMIGGGISGLTTILVASGEREKYRRERPWELRREAYTKIIGALDRALAITAHINDGYGGDPHSWDASEANAKAQAQMIEHFHIARIEFHANRLMLSPAFVAKYEEMNQVLGEANNPNLLPPESAGMAVAAMRRVVPDMEALAKQELGVDF
ncbi:hypothetical protein [Sphingobium sp.]|uniref:hypothetical protein n=1 Tax=Sphingobium sp. TaxID=1912891 RepID=UPI0028BE08F0|nr:hypothetical protein [Sphingobium sp.]